jgi:hypothetical protein
LYLAEQASAQTPYLVEYTASNRKIALTMPIKESLMLQNIHSTTVEDFSLRGHWHPTSNIELLVSPWKWE